MDHFEQIHQQKVELANLELETIKARKQSKLAFGLAFYIATLIFIFFMYWVDSVFYHPVGGNLF